MQRDQTIDTARGLAIVLVVCAHAVMAVHGFDFTPQALLGGVHYSLGWSLQALVVDVNYAVALPMFGFVTGVTLLYTSRRGWSLVKARSKSLLVPYLSWLALGTVLVAVRSGLAAVPHNIVIGTVSAGASASLWFLYALFVCVCVFACCRSDRALVITACIAPFVMVALAWQHVDYLEIRDAAWLYPPLVAGYLVVKHKPRRYLLPAAAVAAVALPLVAMVSPWGLVFAQLPTVLGETAYTLTRVVGGVAGCLVVYGLLRPVTAVAWLGRRTLGIYALHPLIAQAAIRFGVHSVWLVIPIALGGATLITLALEQVPLTRILLLGQSAKSGRAPKGTPARA